VRCERGELPPPDRTLHNTGKDSRRTEAPRGLHELRLLEHFGMQPSSDVLDVGCGIGRLTYECGWYLDDDATYAGLDISPAVIDWLNTNYAPRLPGFRFDFLDVYNESYRPSGSDNPEQVRFPYEDEQFDVVCAFEVFMHVSLDAVRHYLREITRVLRPGGLAVVTFVGVYPDEQVSFDAEYVQVGEGIYTTRPDRVSSDMAYDVELVRAALTDAGLEEIGSVKGRTHTPLDSRPGVADGIELPALYHGCDVLAGRKGTTQTAARTVDHARPSRWRLGRKKPSSEPSPIQVTGTAIAAPTVPGAPTMRSAVAGDGTATVTWDAPASDGGSPITGYAVTAHVVDRQPAGRIFASTATTQTVTELRNGEQYRFWVRAYNDVGISAYSAASDPITPSP
jgi:SAM-dependent methyltransferase